MSGAGIGVVGAAGPVFDGGGFFGGCGGFCGGVLLFLRLLLLRLLSGLLFLLRLLFGGGGSSVGEGGGEGGGGEGSGRESAEGGEFCLGERGVCLCVFLCGCGGGVGGVGEGSGVGGIGGRLRVGVGEGLGRGGSVVSDGEAEELLCLRLCDGVACAGEGGEEGGRGGGVALFLCAEGEVGEDGFTGESGAEDGGGPLGIHRAGDAACGLKKPEFSQCWIFFWLIIGIGVW